MRSSRQVSCCWPRGRRAALAIGCSVLVSLPMLSPPAGAQPARTSHAPLGTTAVCGPAPSGSARCLAWVLDVPSTWRGRRSAADMTSPLAPANGYGPADIASAYALPSATRGRGQVVAVVDAYDDPNAESDLAFYRAAYALPPCTTANGCFRKVDETGGTNYPHGNWSWAEEISIDLDMVSAVCPNCDILLVEASSSSIPDLGSAVDTAATMGANAITNSYGANENQKDSSYDTLYYNHPGVAITVASGDRGYGAYYPASSPWVTSVGGTTLLPAANSRGWSETAWSDTTSGCSTYEPKPAWQTDTGCANRTIADVAAIADPSTGVAVYDTYKLYGWQVQGGTSAASPIIAAVYALAGNESTLTYGSLLYSASSGLNDVLSGSTGNCGTYLCNAGPGYDGPTGNGTPDGTKAF